MKYLISGTLRPERTREELGAKIKDKVISDEAWELVRKGVISEHGFKIGRRPEFIGHGPPVIVGLGPTLAPELQATEDRLRPYVRQAVLRVLGS
jgi:hypothetical protein